MNPEKKTSFKCQSGSKILELKVGVWETENRKEPAITASLVSSLDRNIHGNMLSMEAEGETGSSSIHYGHACRHTVHTIRNLVVQVPDQDIKAKQCGAVRFMDVCTGERRVRRMGAGSHRGDGADTDSEGCVVTCQVDRQGGTFQVGRC